MIIQVIYPESPNSLTFELQDIEAFAAIAREREITTLIDNSYSPPLTQSPATMGVDIVLHSASKYPGGHSMILIRLLIKSGELYKIERDSKD